MSSPGPLGLHFLSMFCSAYSSQLMHLPTHLYPLFPTAPSAPHLPYSTLLALSSSAFILPWLPVCPCDSHGLALPSAPLLLPTPPTRLREPCCYLLQAETPLSIFPPPAPLTGAPTCKHCAPFMEHVVVTRGCELQHQFIAY